MDETPDDDGIEFIDAENYHPTPKGSMTYEQIVLQQINRCVVEGSKEMAGGYFKEKVTRHGIVEQYIPDQKQVYIQCINSLYDLLLSYFDDEMKEFDEEFKSHMIGIKEDKIDKLKEKLKYLDIDRLRGQIQLQIDSGYLDPDSLEAKQAIDERMDAYRVLFQQLILLFGRKRYLMAQAIED